MTFSVFFASGKTLHVHRGLDLVDVALAMHKDDKSAIQRWMHDGQLHGVSDDESKKLVRTKRNGMGCRYCPLGIGSTRGRPTLITQKWIPW